MATELRKVEDSHEPGEDTVVVAPRPGVKVYENPHEMIVIRNSGDPYDDDTFTLIHPDDAERVAQALIEAASDIRSRR